jgi:hypothetical protein
MKHLYETALNLKSWKELNDNVEMQVKSAEKRDGKEKKA